MEPRLVREVRSRVGVVVASYAPRTVRRVVAPAVAAQLRDVLAEVVSGGTGTQAAVGPFPVAGKTGTARLFHDGRYESGAYTASFAGFFPARDPQLVFLVKLDRPQGAYFGGVAAAPITRATLEAALAAWRTPLDRGAVARSARPLPPESAAAHLASAPLPAPVPEAAAEPLVSAPAPVPAVFTLDRGLPGRPAPGPQPARAVPAVLGLPLRDAARRLWANGFRVQVAGGGMVTASLPAAGTVAPHGSVVHLQATSSARVAGAPVPASATSGTMPRAAVGRAAGGMP